MKKILLPIVVLALLGAMGAISHGGGLDKKGGHNCSAKSKKKGLCTGYHYHRPKNTEHTHE